MITSSRRAYVWIWLPGETSPVAAGLVERNDQDRYRFTYGRRYLASGLYNNSSEVIREALRFLETHEEWINEFKLARLREQINQGLIQLDQGQGMAVESKESLDRLFTAIKVEA